MLLMIDNYDSFTYNLVQYFGELGAELKIFRNDKITLDDIYQLNPEKIIISPGPCTPNEAGISLSLIKEFAGKKPILGVCLGHQGIAQAFGANIVRAKQVMHGKLDNIHHNNQGVFNGLGNPFIATRYHSLVIDPDTLSDEFLITAWAKKSNQRDEIMGIKHKQIPLEGVQFHPESIATEYGKELLNNFLQAGAHNNETTLSR